MKGRYVKSEIEPSFLDKRNVLFVVDKKHGISEQDYITDGSVLSVDENRGHALVSFLFHGYKSTVEPVPFSHILAVIDTNGSHFGIDRFSGTGHDLRGKGPFGTHPLAT